LKKGGPKAEKMRGVLKARMNDVSEFNKTLKQRFATWYNRTHTRFGPLWSDRFKSVLVESDSYAIETVAEYIDLNPVRAGVEKESAEMREVRPPPNFSPLWSQILQLTSGKVLGSRDFVERIVDEFLIFREVATRRRSPIDVSGVSGLCSGTSVRRLRTRP